MSQAPTSTSIRNGNATGIEDVFSKVDRARKHYAEVGLGADYVNQLIH